MELARFKRILSAFADNPEKVLVEPGRIVAEIHGQVLSAGLRNDGGSLVVVEDDNPVPAARWITQRIAQLPTLARRIVEYIPSQPHFIEPRATVDGFWEKASSLEPKGVESASVEMTSLLDDQIAGTCSVLYLTSDAGEGKTTIINETARRIAGRYLDGSSNWLLIPISLGGRPFLRFDDVIVAALVNQLRFPRLYYEAFIELVRFGAIVPALDGFEEVFVETADGEGVSSLATLLGQLSGEGRILIAARKAYFEYKSLETQARLLDALSDVDVAFAKVELERWGQVQFTDYARRCGVVDAAQLYKQVADRVSPTHPLLTRAVLVRRLVDVASDPATRQSLIATLQPESQAFFSSFIETIIDREVREKWLDKGGEAARPLLSAREHHELLGLLAEEMWVSKSASLAAGMCDSLADMFCEQNGKPPTVSRQVRERLKQHALLVKTRASRDSYGFDHDHFREFFLGEQIGRSLVAGTRSDTRRSLRIDVLPVWVVEVVHHQIREAKREIATRALLDDLAGIEGPTSFLRENCGAIILGTLGAEGTEVSGHLFPLDALSRARVENCTFRRCHFRSTALAPDNVARCEFSECVFERLELDRQATFSGIRVDESCQVHCLAVRTESGDVLDLYDPATIRDELLRRGLGIARETAPTTNQLEFELDQELRLVDKVVRTFQRTTHVNEGTLRLRLSKNAHIFFNNIQADMERLGILVRMTHRGSGIQHHWRLGVSVTEIAAAMAEARGNYQEFLRILERQRR